MVGRSRFAPHEEQRRAWKTTGFVASELISCFLAAVSVR
jgi:hypothetical protein